MKQLHAAQCTAFECGAVRHIGVPPRSRSCAARPPPPLLSPFSPTRCSHLYLISFCALPCPRHTPHTPHSSPLPLRHTAASTRQHPQICFFLVSGACGVWVAGVAPLLPPSSTSSPLGSFLRATTRISDGVLASSGRLPNKTAVWTRLAAQTRAPVSFLRHTRFYLTTFLCPHTRLDPKPPARGHLGPLPCHAWSFASYTYIAPPPAFLSPSHTSSAPPHVTSQCVCVTQRV